MKTKLVIILLIMIPNCFLFAQSCDRFQEKANEFYAKGDINEAIKVADSGVIICKNEFGIESNEYANSITTLAVLCQELAIYTKAEILYKKAIKIKKNIFGEYHIEYAISLENLGLLYYQNGNYKEAENLFIKTLDIKEKLLGNENLDYATSLNNLAGLYNEMGIFSKAESLYIKTINIRKKVPCEIDFDYSCTLNGLGLLYFRIGNYTKAEPLFIEAIDIRKKVLGEENSYYTTSLNNLALLYCKTENYAKAEPLYIQSLNIIKKSLGENLDYATSLNNLAGLYDELGNFDKAELLYMEAINIIKNLLGKDNKTYATSLNNLASLYDNLKKYSKAESLYIEVLNIRKRNLGELHPDYATALNNLAILYNKIGKFKKAEPLFIKSTTILKKKLGELHPDYATLLNNLAGLYLDMGNYSKSETLYLKAIEIRRKIFGEQNPSFVNSVSNLANLYERNRKLKQASINFSYSLSLIKNNWSSNLSFLNYNEADSFIGANLYAFEAPLSFQYRHQFEIVKLQLFDLNLFVKGLLLNTNRLLEQSVLNCQDTSMKYIWLKYKNLRLSISRNLQLPIYEQKNINELKRSAQDIEKELKRKIPDFKELIENTQLTWREIKQKLKPNEAVIDFISFRYYDNRPKDSILYAAFLLRLELKEPQFIKLFNEDQLAELFGSSNNSFSINNLYCTKDSSCNFKIYNLVWKPMDSLLTGVKRVYISPSGLLNRVSFSAIPIPGGGRLIDRYSVEVMSNIRTIAETKSNVSEKPLSISLIGGVNYDEEPTVSDSQQVNFLTSDTSFSNLRSLKGGKWSYLLGAESEVITINKVLAPLKMSLSLKTGSNASEEFVKEMGSGIKSVPSVMHIATHGFSFASPKLEVKHEKSFLQNDNKQVFRSSEDALTRAGLVMAGGNKFWTTGTTYQNHEDGILTAREISELNLNGCILATLSACETGLGEIKGSEGVFGLQRAFKMAGVKYLIVSLWKVPDAQTTEFMQLFYSSWLIQKLPIREAFHQTQLTMSKKYLPYQWAAFVLVE